MAGEFTFLMCSERSGSNLVTRMLDAHRQCCGPAPTHLVRVLAENLHRYGDLSHDSAWRAFLTDAADLLATMTGAWSTAWTAGDLAALTPGRDPGELLRRVFRAEAKVHGKPHLFIKENHLYRYLDFVEQAFADARIVAMVRDPRDMALSWKRSPILRGDVVRAARIWREDQSRLLEVRDRVGPNVFHLLTYEGLVSDPETRLAEVCAFLGLDYDPAMAAPHRRLDATEAASLTDDWKNLARPVMRDNFAKWRQGLSRTEAAYVERICSSPMTELGYELECEDRRPLEELEGELLPLERHEKPGWADVPAAEQEIRAARVAVVRRITSREPEVIRV
ncbi:MAG: sulfotransferase [bacterium]|nr:sulfotransferase [bacterium]